MVTISDLFGAPRYPKLQQIMQAAKKNVTRWTAEDLGLDPSTVGAAGARLKLERLFMPTIDTKVELMVGRHPGGAGAGAGAGAARRQGHLAEWSRRRSVAAHGRHRRSVTMPQDILVVGELVDGQPAAQTDQLLGAATRPGRGRHRERDAAGQPAPRRPPPARSRPAPTGPSSPPPPTTTSFTRTSGSLPWRRRWIRRTPRSS